MKKKIGIFGGTFDPIHNGHIEAAKLLHKKLKLDEILIIPTFLSPLKIKYKPISAHHRLKMIEIAIKEYEFLKISDYEIKNKKVSYSFNTLRYLNKNFSDSDLFFLLGSDSLLYLDKWYRVDDIFNLSNVVIYSRPEFDQVNYLLSKSNLNIIQKKHLKENMISIITEKISSSDIRKKIFLKKDVSNYLLPQVYLYIVENNLYES